MKCKGFLFDLDGTLVDSLAVVERAWKSWGERHGIAADELLNFIHGKQAITSLRHFMAGASAQEIQQEFIELEKMEAGDTEGIVALPGALQLLATLDELSIPWAIVTSGSVPVASSRHAAAGLPAPLAFVTAERVERGKPEPDAYLLGAQLIDLEPEECVVVEDAAAGILSGLAAGCHVIAVNPPEDAQRLEDVDMVLSSLEELIIHKNADGSVNIYRRH
ncbi:MULTISPECIES: sugar phosphatase [Erwinia]|uniref:sugar phosphatase n=1 Tax=Erwinia pyrifoliae TaxID=79967 RepID=UPI000196085F|nr:MULTISPECIES: sugar phosphatase [Erwinia]ADP13121.1 putative phosphatase [Erwinia sp. Ejp617]AUX73218.1 sugar phosphatase [Erwinia pyrifoliae]MCA8876496.1 sugar phosphatase [Erwinia pyrifoliae]UXK11160.1 sugar phosphatase [Erwinia pyrifoliae]CAX55031.1 Putative phosphatase [Erwinia pyrifoliae Ep1/96]